MQPALMDQASKSFKDKLRGWRRALKARLPYVRRRTYNLVLKRELRFIEDISLRSCASDSVALVALKAWNHVHEKEVCLFVTHATQPHLKEQVSAHVEQLLQAGIAVVLILNTDLSSDELRLDTALTSRLHGVYVRANAGFDFAAWSHVWKLTHGLPGCTRLLLANDSVLGPLNTEHYQQIIRRIRESRADVVGLTEAPEPRPHLQSYFLAIQGQALRSELFGRFFDNLLCLPDKDMVIATYEARLTGYLAQAGFACESLFSGPIPGGHTENDTYYRWAELISCGFPFLKTSVMALHREDPRMLELVPSRFRAL